MFIIFVLCVNTGVEIVRRALRVPITQIVQNTGVDPSGIVEAVIKADSYMGYDALTCKHVNMMDAGIVDPTKVCMYCVVELLRHEIVYTLLLKTLLRYYQ